ncbi:hypothetical protein GCM10009416_14380 [Craurococcus roseus]|uniref:Uncharacterized protein n=1 Tax=Craurococcus roseus TaxID=77585 RepID=A0ABN1EYG5_9PROT
MRRPPPRFAEWWARTGGRLANLRPPVAEQRVHRHSERSPSRPIDRLIGSKVAQSAGPPGASLTLSVKGGQTRMSADHRTTANFVRIDNTITKLAAVGHPGRGLPHH